MGDEKYYDITAHMQCMACQSRALHVHLNFQEKHNGSTYDVSHIPNENDYVSQHCQPCGTITVFKITDVKSIRRVRGPDVLMTGGTQ